MIPPPVTAALLLGYTHPWAKLATVAAFMGGVTPPLELLLLGGVDPPMGGKCYCCCRGVAI